MSIIVIVIGLAAGAMTWAFSAPTDQMVFPSPSLQKVKSAPKRYSETPDVVAEWVETAEACEADKICVEGVLYNQGRRPATGIRLLVEIGSSKYGKPRTSFHRAVEQTSMEPGDRQDFAFTIDRKIPYKQQGLAKEIEVGKYNFRVTPLWAGKETIKSPRTSRKN